MDPPLSGPPKGAFSKNQEAFWAEGKESERDPKLSQRLSFWSAFLSTLHQKHPGKEEPMLWGTQDTSVGQVGLLGVLFSRGGNSSLSGGGNSTPTRLMNPRSTEAETPEPELGSSAILPLVCIIFLFPHQEKHHLTCRFVEISLCETFFSWFKKGGRTNLTLPAWFGSFDLDFPISPFASKGLGFEPQSNADLKTTHCLGDLHVSDNQNLVLKWSTQNLKNSETHQATGPPGEPRCSQKVASMGGEK